MMHSILKASVQYFFEIFEKGKQSRLEIMQPWDCSNGAQYTDGCTILLCFRPRGLHVVFKLTCLVFCFLVLLKLIYICPIVYKLLQDFDLTVMELVFPFVFQTANKLSSFPCKCLFLFSFRTDVTCFKPIDFIMFNLCWWLKHVITILKNTECCLSCRNTSGGYSFKIWLICTLVPSVVVH